MLMKIGCAEGFFVPLVAAFGCLLVQPSKAATITYSVSGSYGPSTPVTSLTAPNATFLFQFTVPLPASPTATAGSIEFTLSDPIIYLLSGAVATCNGAGEFFSHFFTPTTDSLGLTCENGSTIIDLDLGGTPILSTGSIT